MQPCERELLLRLDARRPRDVASGRALHQVLQQRGLADSGLAAQDEHPASTLSDTLDQLVQCRALGAPAMQHWHRRAIEHGEIGEGSPTRPGDASVK